MLQRVKEVQESDLRMDGALARNIQRVIAVTQADIDAAAAQGKAWVVKPVVKVSDPLDNLRGGTQLVIKQNSILPGQNVMRVMYIGGQAVVVGPGTSPLSLPDATDNDILSLIAFGGTEQRNIPDNYIERQFIYMMDSSYLLTDIVPTPDCKIEFDFQTLTIVSGARTYLGCRDTSGSNDGLRVAHISNGNFRIYGFGTYADSATAAQANTRYKFIWDNKRATITSAGTTIFDNTFAAEGTNQTAVAINGWNTAGTVDANSEGMYLYSLKIWNGNGELIADYVPAVQRGTVPVVGFYDTVSKTFKTATAGTFAAGGEAVPTPDYPMDIVSNNGVLKYSRNKVNVIADNVAVGKYISATGVLTDSENNFTYMPYVPVKPNTTYTLTYSSPIYFGSVSEYSSAEDAGFVVRQTKTSTSLNEPFDLTEFTFTTGATTNYVRFGCNMYKNQSLTIDDVLALNYMLAESATAVPYAPYVGDNGGIYTDGTVETINVHGKNLFNVSANPLEQGGIASNDGQNTVGSYNQRVRTNGYIPVKPNTVYTASVKDLQIYYLEYAQDTTYTNRHASGFSDNSVTFTTGANTYFVRLQFRKSDNSDITPSEVTNVQLEQGSTDTDYVPYYDGGTATAEMLLKISDYQDVQSIIDGVITRKVGIKVLDGTESWSYKDTYSRFVTNISDMPADTARTLPFISTHYQVTYSSTTDPGYIYNSSQRQIMITDAHTSVESWTQWLADQYAAGTPVIVIYPLATATTESVTGQPMATTAGDNIAEITQASLNNLELQVEYIGE